MNIKESVRHTVFKNNNYTEQPSSWFLYIDDEKNTALNLAKKKYNSI